MINEETAKFGVEVTQVKIFNLTLDEATRMFLTAQKRAELQNALRLQEAENQRQIRDTLHMSNDQLLRWWEIEARKESPPTSEANIFIGDENRGANLLPSSGPFTARQPNKGNPNENTTPYRG